MTFPKERGDTAEVPYTAIPFLETDVAPDALFAATAACKACEDPNKINGVLGIIRDNGMPYVHPSVEEGIMEVAMNYVAVPNQEYLPMAGDPRYLALVKDLIFPNDDPSKIAAIGTPGGLGAINASVQLLRRGFRSQEGMFQGKTPRFHIADRLWGPWAQVIEEIFGPEAISRYPHLKLGSTTDFNVEGFENLAQAGNELPIYPIQAICQNPTGVDPTPDEVRRMGAKILAERGIVLIDSAYLGFDAGITEDRYAIDILHDMGVPMMVQWSGSKLLTMYKQRVGAALVPAPTGKEDEARILQSHLQRIARTTYSNPPAFGQEVAGKVLGDEERRSRLLEEDMPLVRARMGLNRRIWKTAFGDEMEQRRGMFENPFTGAELVSDMTVERAVADLRDKFHVFLAPNGRACIAAMTPGEVIDVAELIQENYLRQNRSEV